jgi:REP element-mobilizing transposase RayT
MSYEFAEGYKIRDQSSTHFLTFTVMGWIDIFSRKRYKDIIINSLNYCKENKGLQIAGYVIMTNHIHFIWTAKNSNLSDVVRDFKTFTSKAILKSIQEETESRKDWLLYMFKFYANRTNENEVFKLWTGSNHPEVIYSKDFLLSKLNYIHQNPVRAGIVAEPEHYIYSSATNYSNNNGIIEIDFLY